MCRSQTTFKVGKNETVPDVIATVDTMFFPIHALRRLWTFPDGEHAFLVTMAEKMTDEMVNDCFRYGGAIRRRKTNCSGGRLDGVLSEIL